MSDRTIEPGETVIVAGFGRCGSSMVMQMLDYAGAPVFGSYPAYEELPGGYWSEQPSEWLKMTDGKAFKVLDPHRWPLPPGRKYRLIWLDRDYKEQAKSALKMLNAVLPMVDPNDKRAIRDMARSYRRDRPRAIADLRRVGADIMTISFEELVTSPLASAKRIAEHLRLPLDHAAMAHVVLNRPASCLPFLLEGMQLAAAEFVDARG